MRRPTTERQLLAVCGRSNRWKSSGTKDRYTSEAAIHILVAENSVRTSGSHAKAAVELLVFLRAAAEPKADIIPLELQMKDPQEIPWKRIVVEATAIVASILLAFAIDAWWQDRTERKIEDQYLHALREDILSSLELLDDDEASQQQQVEYLESLLLTNANTPYSDELRLWIDDGLFNVGTYQPQISALHDLESSGQTQIIQNQDLRRVLASVRQKLNDLVITQRDFQLSQQTLIDPYIVDNFNLSILMLDRAGNSETNLTALGSSDFQSRVAFKISLRGEVSQSQHEVRVAFTEALELIETELETTN